MATVAHIPDETPTPKPMPGSRMALAQVRTKAAIAVARFQLDGDPVAVSDTLDEIVRLCSAALAAEVRQ